jgi:hypothetical protein
MKVKTLSLEFTIIVFVFFTFSLRLISSDAEKVFKLNSDNIVKVTTFNQLNRAIKSGSGVVLGKSKSTVPNTATPEQRGFIRSNANGDDIISSYHVVAFASKLIIETKSGQKCEAGIVYFDSDSDIAILRTATAVSKTTPRIAANLNIGQRVYAIGNPSGFDWSISDGIISGFRTNNGSELIQFTAPISAGSSGGGLFNSEGELVGLPTLQIKDSQNLNFAVNIVSQSNFNVSAIRSGILVLPDALDLEDWEMGYFYAQFDSAQNEFNRFKNAKRQDWEKYKWVINFIDEIKFSESLEGKIGRQTENPALFVLNDAQRFIELERSNHFEYDISGGSYSGNFVDDESKLKNMKQLISIRDKFRGVLAVESNYYAAKSDLIINDQEQIKAFQKEILEFIRDMPHSSESGITQLSNNAKIGLNGFIEHVKRISRRFKMIDVERHLESKGF